MANRRPDDNDEADRSTNRLDREAVGDDRGNMGQADDMAPYSGVGADLRSARERVGLTITDVAQRLRIRERQLRAIEDGTFEEVPGQVYARGFIRTYAELMGLDGEALVERFKAETGHVAAPAKLEFPTPTPESRMPRMGLVLLAILLAATAYAGWYYMNDIRNFATELVSDVPGRLEEGAAGGGSQPSSGEEPAQPERKPDGGLGAGEGQSLNAAPAKAEPAATASSKSTGPTVQPQSNFSTVASREATGGGNAATAERRQDNTGKVAATVSATPTESQREAAAVRQTGEQTGMQAEPLSEPNEPPTPAASSSLAETASTPAAPVDGDRPQQTATEPPAPQQSASIATPPPPAIPNTGTENGEYVPQVFGIGNVDARVALRARLDCWVQVLGPDGEQLLTRILRAGDVYLVPNRPDLKLFASDAGALEVMVDGKSIPPIGSSGQVLRNVSLDAAALLERRARSGG